MAGYGFLLMYSARETKVTADLRRNLRPTPRSGLAWKHSIDADYRGPVGVLLFNHSDVDFDRIAQLIIEKIVTPEVMEVEDLDNTVTVEGGFGSTGV